MAERLASDIRLRNDSARFGLVCAIYCLVWMIPFHSLWASELRETPIVKAIQRVRNSVVNIRGEKTVASAGQTASAEANRRVNGMGTGVIIDPRGYIITNYHVVDGVRKILVTLADGEQHVAKLIARDTETDLAVIKIDAGSMLPVIPLGSSNDLMPGETVIAVGNAYGYEHTVTRGIVSALHRAVQVSDAQFYDDLIQTDASINPGNSGGPLLNIDGDMIGINVAVRAGAQGIGFAIPVNKVVLVAASLLDSSSQMKVWSGVTAIKDSPASKGGTIVEAVKDDSPAAQAGLISGDVVTAIDDQTIERSLDFRRALLDLDPGQKVRLAVRRSGETLSLNLKLADMPEMQNILDEQPAWARFGLKLRSIPNEDFRKNHQTRYRGGLYVTEVRPNSPAAGQGILPGDVLVGMHVWETISIENVAYILNRPEVADLDGMKFFILRGDETLYGFLPAGPTKTALR